MKKFDVTVIGAGPGGYVAAIKAAQLGEKVAIIEKDANGGTCLNRGCIPTKALVASADAYQRVNDAEEFGVIVKKASFDWGKISERKDGVVKKLRNGIGALLKSNKIEIIKGNAKLISRNKIEIEAGKVNETIESKKIILATGSEPAKPGFFPFDGKKVLDSTDLLKITKLPKSIIIVGGGVIGCEFANILNTFGVKVTVVEMLDRLLPIEDKDISTAVTRKFKKSGIDVITGVAIENVKITANGVGGKIEGKPISAEIMLVGVGRSLNTKNIGLETVGVKLDKIGAVIVNERMQTSVANIYAIGDITNKMQLAHVASAQGIVAAINAAGGMEKMDYRVVPNCIFTIPEIGTVGMTEAEAKEAGDIKVGKFYYAGLGKALAAGEPEGFYKIIADAKTDEILGAQVYGAHATDIIAEAAIAMKLESTAEELGKTIHAHPTLAEGMMEAAHALHGECIHMPAK